MFKGSMVALVTPFASGKIDEKALAEVKSDTFGEMIKEDIDNIGLEHTARNLLGDKFDKLAAESLRENNVKTSATETPVQKFFILKGMLATLKNSLANK